MDVLEYALSEWQRLQKACHLSDTYNAAIHIDPELIPEKDGTLDDAYTIDADASGMVIVASNERSALQAVYRFFYHLGVRYLAPGVRYDQIPAEIPEEAFQQHETVIPPLRHRGICIEGADSVENVVDMIDWLPKIGMNSFFVQFKTPHTFLQRWYEHIGNDKSNALYPAAELPMEASDEFSCAIDEAMAMRGIVHHRVGHGWTGAVLGTGAYGWDAEKTPITPEQQRIAAEIDGKRDFFHGIPLETNLCYSDPEVQEAFAEQVVNYAKAHPEVDLLHVWLADSVNSFCECENCRKGTPSDHYVALLNCIDERLYEEGLETRIVFLTYLDLMWAPAHEKLWNPDRFVMMFAPISRSFNSAYEDAGTLPAVPKFQLNHIELPVDLEGNLAFLKDWQQKFDGDSFVYDYHLGRAHFGDMGYAHIARTIYRDIKYLPELQLNGQISCQELRAGMPNFLPNYVMGMAGSLTDPDFEEIQEDYYKHIYGPNWEDLRDYLDTLSALSSCDYFNLRGPRLDPALCQDMKQMLAIVQNYRPELLAMHGEDPIQERFLDLLKYHSYYVEKYASALILRTQGQDAQPVYEDLMELVQSHEDEFQEFFDVYRLHELLPRCLGTR